MLKAFRIFLSIIALAAVGMAVAYFVVLPRLAQPGPARDFAGISADSARGKYLVSAAGCVACHTDLKKKGRFLAGGPALVTPFGTFYAPNITPDVKTGIGGWSLAQFSRALTEGVAPDERHYFPSFPYTSYTGMTSQDIADLKAYLDGVAPVQQASRPHDLAWPFSDRQLVAGWKSLYFERRGFEPNSNKPPGWNRGGYLVNVLGHCGECHTYRDPFGGRTGLPLAGNTRGPEGANVPSIRNLATRAEPWSADQLLLSLQVGMVPSGDFIGDAMAEVVSHSTSKLTAEDQSAIAGYLLSLR